MKSARPRSTPGFVLGGIALVLAVALAILARPHRGSSDLVALESEPDPTPSASVVTPQRPSADPTTDPTTPTSEPSAEEVRPSGKGSSGAGQAARGQAAPGRAGGRTAQTRTAAVPSARPPATRAAPAPPPPPTVSIVARGITQGQGWATVMVTGFATTENIASLTIQGGPRAVGIAVGRLSPGWVSESIGGLELGRSHAFTARVCTTGGGCASSGPATVAFTAPDPGAITLSRSGVATVIRWAGVADATAGTTCRVTLRHPGGTWTVPSGPPGTAGGSYSVYLTRGAYQAVRTCTWEGGTVESQSNQLVI